MKYLCCFMWSFSSKTLSISTSQRSHDLGKLFIFLSECFLFTCVFSPGFELVLKSHKSQESWSASKFFLFVSVSFSFLVFCLHAFSKYDDEMRESKTIVDQDDLQQDSLADVFNLSGTLTSDFDTETIEVTKYWTKRNFMNWWSSVIRMLDVPSATILRVTVSPPISVQQDTSSATPATLGTGQQLIQQMHF